MQYIKHDEKLSSTDILIYGYTIFVYGYPYTCKYSAKCNLFPITSIRSKQSRILLYFAKWSIISQKSMLERMLNYVSLFPELTLLIDIR